MDTTIRTSPGRMLMTFGIMLFITSILHVIGKIDLLASVQVICFSLATLFLVNLTSEQ